MYIWELRLSRSVFALEVARRLGGRARLAPSLPLVSLPRLLPRGFGCETLEWNGVRRQGSCLGVSLPEFSRSYMSGVNEEVPPVVLGGKLFFEFL